MTATALTPTNSQKLNKAKFNPLDRQHVRVVYNLYDAVPGTCTCCNWYTVENTGMMRPW